MLIINVQLSTYFFILIWTQTFKLILLQQRLLQPYSTVSVRKKTATETTPTHIFVEDAIKMICIANRTLSKQKDSEIIKKQKNNAKSEA